MENEAVRFETATATAATGDGIDFILKDLQLNEHLRESARAAELVQRNLRTVHTGDSRGVKQAGFMVLTTARRLQHESSGRTVSDHPLQPEGNGGSHCRRDCLLSSRI
jgi:hypothetical protein